MKIAIVGALWADNFGDVLLAKILKDKLEEMGHDVYLPNASLKVKEQLNDTNKYKLKLADEVIFCGGGYFSEPPGNSLKWAASRYKSLFRFATYCKYKKIPYYILGVGAGPINSWIAKKVVSHVCDSAELILARDDISYNEIFSISKNKNIELVSDLVLSIKNESEGSDKECKNKVGIHLTHNALNIIEPTFQFIERNNNKFDFFLIEDNSGTFDKLCDYDLRFKEYFNDDNIITYHSIDGFLKDLSSLDSIITSKLHVGIIGAAYNKKVCALPYHAKVKRLYSEILRPELVLDNAENEKDDIIYSHIERCLNSIPIVIPNEVINRSEKIIKKIDEIFVR